jgi:hypothetical protein
MAIHRVVAADAHEGDVEVVALARQSQVGEQGGVAEVVDGRVAEPDDDARSDVRRSVGRDCGVQRRHHPHPAAGQLDRPAEVGVDHVLDALAGDLVGQLDDRDHRRAGPLGDLDGVAEVVGVAVGQDDVRRIDVVRRDSALGVAGQERVDQDARVPLGQLEAGLSQKANLHPKISSV